jgi:hypothetical protein
MDFVVILLKFLINRESIDFSINFHIEFDVWIICGLKYHKNEL